MQRAAPGGSGPGLDWTDCEPAKKLSALSRLEVSDWPLSGRQVAEGQGQEIGPLALACQQ